MHKKHIKQRNTSNHMPECLQDLPDFLARILVARDISHAEQLDNTLGKLVPYNQLNGIDAAVDILLAARTQQAHIMIVGDYDADGATSTAVAMRALKMLGFTHTSYLVPNRFKYGYGLSPELVDDALKQKPDMIITVDNGVAAIDGVAKAKQAGLKVIVTDHHLAGDTLPDADAMINPNVPGCSFPYKSTAGVGVVFYLMLALRAALRDKNLFDNNCPEPNLAGLLDLVALGTVADVVPLEHNNRVMVAQGLSRIRAGKCCAGIRALVNIAGRNIKNLVASDLGFFIAPRLNAAGRLDDMTVGIECLLTDDPDKAYQLAEQLDQLNRSRKQIEMEMQRTAGEILDNLHVDDTSVQTAYCLYSSEWHEGVIGILASRIKDKMHRPVIAFAGSDDGQILKGSGRSIHGLHMRDALDRVDRVAPGLIKKFGGHAMAAGLTIAADDFDKFNSLFIAQVEQLLDEADMQNVIYTDGEMELVNLTLQSAELLQKYGPWGQGFPEPVFHGEFDVFSAHIVGQKHVKFVLKKADQPYMLDAIAFNVSEEILADQPDKILTAYRLSINEFRGERTAQLMLDYVEAIEA